MSDPSGSEQVLDVRGMPKPDKHPTIFAAYDALASGEALVLVNDHDPKHLRDEFELDRAGSFSWDYLSREQRDWRIRIGKLTSAPLPRIVGDTSQLAAEADSSGAAGAVWKLQVRDRDLDANVVALRPDESIAVHTGPDLDVLIHVLAGSGTLTTEATGVDLSPGALVWLPRRSVRAFTAGSEGLRYLTVHRRRAALVLETTTQASTAT